jgi:excisionase family DNA binding protein
MAYLTPNNTEFGGTVKNKLAYSIEDAAAALSIGRTKLYELINAGELKPVKIGRRTLIMHSALEALLEKFASQTHA